MEYTVVPAPEKANDGWMAHHVKLWVDADRHEEFFNYLNTYCGPKHEAWRVESRTEKTFWIWGNDPMKVRFKHKKHAALLKLQWEEDEDPIKKDLEYFKNLSKSFGSFNFASARSTGKSIMGLQSIGRGIRNAQMTSVKPSASPTPWYDSLSTLHSQGAISNRYFAAKALGIDELEQKYIDHLFLDTEASVSPYWLQKNLEDQGHKVITTKVLKERLNGTGRKQTTLRWDPEALRIWDELPSDAEPEDGPGDNPSDV